jgi:D-alanyl-D-alanine carboxypeptidase
MLTLTLFVGSGIGLSSLSIKPAKASSVVQKQPTPDYFGPHLVFELETGRVIKASKAQDLWYPASTTKMMTAYVVFQAVSSGRLSWDSPVVMSAHAVRQPPSKSYLKQGTVLKLSNALKFLMVKSANDIAVALAETVSGSEKAFVAEMNQAARQLGMTRSHFTNPHGLPDNRMVTTAYDLALLTTALHRDFSPWSGFFSLSAVKLGAKTYKNYNVLIDRYQGAIGYKTGYICAAGYNLVAGAHRSGKTVVAVVMGARSGLERAAITKSLLDKAFESRQFFIGQKDLSEIGRMQGVDTAYNMRPLTCKSPRQKPSHDELMARYGSVMAFANPSSSLAGDGGMPRLAALHSSDSDGGENDGMEDGGKLSIIDRLIGPRLRQPQPIEISLNDADMSLMAEHDRQTMARALWPQLPPLPLARPGRPHLASSSGILMALPERAEADTSSSGNSTGSLVPFRDQSSDQSARGLREGWQLRLTPSQLPMRRP